MEGWAVDNELTIRLTRDEALVLFDWISRFSAAGGADRFEHGSEQLILWHLEAILEKELIEPFDDNYRGLLQAARERLKSD
jgi:hypothetical protein